MKKLLSILLTLCLLIAVTVIPVPAMAADGEISFEYGSYEGTTFSDSYNIGDPIEYPELPAHSDGTLVWSLYDDVYEEPPAVYDGEVAQVYVVLLEGVFNFESYSPDSYIKWSGRVQPLAEPGNTENTVIQFNNNGIPYQSEAVAISATYKNSGVIVDSVYTPFADTQPAGTSTTALTTAFKTAVAGDGYANYYNITADYNHYNSNTSSFLYMDSYNSIELNQLDADTTYRITINYKRISLEDDLYIMPATWSESATKRTNTTSYNDARITIPAGTDSAYTTVSTLITTPEEFETIDDYVGDRLRLILFTGEQYANNVVYFDDITVEEVEVVKLTYHNADGTTKEVNLESGSTIDYLDLAPNKLGENGGVWYADAQGTTPAPAVMPAENLDVYEVVQTGVFDFNNYYRYEDYTGNSFGINSADVVNSIYADGNGNLVVDTTKYNKATNGTVGALRNYVIAIGEAEASTDYKITVEYSYAATNADQRLVLTPLTGYGTLTYTNVNGTDGAIIFGDSIELPQGTNQSIDLFYSSADEFYVNGDKTETAYYKAETGEVANSFYLNVITKEDGQTAGDNAVLATISKVTVVEYVAPAKTFTVTLNRGGVTEEVSVEEGTEYTLPDTEFTDTSWWSNSFANRADRFIGYEGEKVTVTEDITYYTAETYAKGSGANMYQNWTIVEDTTEGLTYLQKTMVETDDETAWEHVTSTRLCTRLGVVEDGNTYKISVTYKATTNTPLDFVMAISAITNPGDAMRNYLEETKVFHTISKNTDGWETVTYYITADTPAKVTENTNGLDDTKDVDKYCALYLMVNKENGAHNVDIAINKTEVVDLGNVVEAKGASVLTDAVAAEAGKQAIRYYFDYATNEGGDGTKITIDGNDYTVVERGFLYTNGDIAHYAKENVKTGNEGYYIYNKGTTTAGFAADHFMMWLAKAKDASGEGLLTYRGVSGDALLKKWNLENNTLTFSTYITNIAEYAYDAKFMVRGYVIFEADGVQHIVYSKTVNRSVNGIKNALAEINE